MKYCVLKDTTTVIDGSENTNEEMFQNATSAGFSKSQVEILTEEEYQARKALEPVPPQPPTDIELLQQENAMLQMSVMELSTYAATQDERLQTQESAIMELSMLIIGGA